jgi:uncharacterized membrane protein
MGIDWTQPFKIAFEVGMWALGWMLVVIIVSFFAFLTYAIIAALIATIRGKNKKQTKSGIISFDKG